LTNQKQNSIIVLCKQYNKERIKIVDYIFNDDRPIYIQLVEMLRFQIVSGKLKMGERIPSVRELALTAKVNPNTMQKALAELESEGLLFTERTNGKFVTSDVELIEKVKRNLAKEKVKSYLDGMKDIGIEKSEAIKYLQELGGEK
jgi:GntR family transcriptional regulator